MNIISAGSALASPPIATVEPLAAIELGVTLGF
jgi:hypothetical protein